MKKFISVLLLVIALSGFAGCSQSGKASFTAKVLENNKTSLLVEPSKDSNESKSSDKMSVSVVNAALVNSKREKTDISKFEPGKQVKITYNGQIAESYPAQIHNCSKIVLMD